MLIRKDQPAAIQPASIVDEIVVRGTEHIDIDPAQFQFLQLHASLIRIVKEHVFPERDLFASGPRLFLPLLISQMVCRTDLGVIIHLFGPDLNLDVASRSIVKEGDVQGSVTEVIRILDIIPGILPTGLGDRPAEGVQSRYLRLESPFFQKIRKRSCDLIQISQFPVLPAFSAL